MKILQVIPFFSPRFGGSVTVPYELSKELAIRKHEITIITTDFGFDSKYADNIRHAGVRVIPFSCIVNLGLFLYSPSINKWLQKNIGEFEIIHMHNFRSYQNISVYKYAIAHNIPYILQAHGSVLPIFEKEVLKKIFDVIWGNGILKNLAYCIALTKTESDQYFRMGVPYDRIEIIPNGLDLSIFANLPKKGTFRSKYGLSQNEKIVLFLGRIHKIKGIDLLIDAYAELFKDAPDTRLVITGPDENYLSIITDQIQKLRLEDRILLTGPLYHREKLEAYVDADVYVLPSRYEIFGKTVLEAWACGTPVIVTTGCHIAEAVEKAGIVVERDPVEMAEAIKKIITDEIFRREIIETGKSLIKNDFNLETVVENFEACYRRIIGDSLNRSL